MYCEIPDAAEVDEDAEDEEKKAEGRRNAEAREDEKASARSEAARNVDRGEASNKNREERGLYEQEWLHDVSGST